MLRVLLAALLAAPFVLQGQSPQLGPPPVAPARPAQAAKRDIRSPIQASSSDWIDTSDRAAVRDFYNNAYAPLAEVPMGWVGNLDTGIAGSTAQAYRDAVASRANWFRSMAGVPAWVALDSTYNAKDQQAAMMMSVNGQLSHNPPESWKFYSAEGAEAASHSNLCLGFSSDPGCMSLYMDDFGTNNAAVGHRRWVLYPQTHYMGTGDVPWVSTYPSANALWVIGSDVWDTRPGTRDEFVAWPPRGYVPYQVVYNRWSFSYHNADFSAATVTVLRNNMPLPVRLETPAQGYGENSIVWVPDNLDASLPSEASPPATDTIMDVAVNNVRVGSTFRDFAYQVIVFDPSAHITVATQPAGLPVIVDGVQYQSPASFAWTPGSVHSLDVTSPRTVGVGTRQVFRSWSNGGSKAQNYTVPVSPATLTATFVTQYLLNCQASPVSGGTCAAVPSAGYPWYDVGSTVQLTATAGSGYRFTGFSGDLTGTTNPQTLVMSAARNVTAGFSAAPANSPPTVTGASPGAGASATQAFTFTFADTNGWQDLGVVNILLNNFLDGRHACYLAYARSINVLYLVNDAGDALLPGLLVNGSGSLSNSQCTVTSPAVTGNGNTMTLAMNMSFPSLFAGNKVFYLAARDSLENNSGWQAVGTWAVPPATTASPRVTGMTPGRGSGMSGQVTFQFSDSHGWQNLGVVNMLLNNFLDGRFGCYMAYARTINVLYLVNDAGNALLPGIVVNGSGTLANSQCTITNPTVSGSGNTMTLRMNVTYGASFTGNRVWYLAARDVIETSSGWQTAGSWIVQ